MNIEQVAVTELLKRAAPYNPRRIEKHDLEALRRSLRFFGVEIEPRYCDVIVRRWEKLTGGKAIGWRGSDPVGAKE